MRAITRASEHAASTSRHDGGHATPAPRPAAPPREGRRRSRILEGARTAAAAVGVVALLALTLGAALDIAAIDRTSGGYDPPYTGYTGDPIDWDADTYTTPTGMVATGYVLDVHTDCTTGMISFDVLGLVTIDYRTVSRRALAIHAPDEACRQRGFEPAF